MSTPLSVAARFLRALAEEGAASYPTPTATLTSHIVQWYDDVRADFQELASLPREEWEERDQRLWDALIAAGLAPDFPSRDHLRHAGPSDYNAHTYEHAVGGFTRYSGIGCLCVGCIEARYPTMVQAKAHEAARAAAFRAHWGILAAEAAELGCAMATAKAGQPLNSAWLRWAAKKAEEERADKEGKEAKAGGRGRGRGKGRVKGKGAGKVEADDDDDEKEDDDENDDHEEASASASFASSLPPIDPDTGMPNEALRPTKTALHRGDRSVAIDAAFPLRYPQLVPRLHAEREAHARETESLRVSAGVLLALTHEQATYAGEDALLALRLIEQLKATHPQSYLLMRLTQGWDSDAEAGLHALSEHTPATIALTCPTACKVPNWSNIAQWMGMPSPVSGVFGRNSDASSAGQWIATLALAEELAVGTSYAAVPPIPVPPPEAADAAADASPAAGGAVAEAAVDTAAEDGASSGGDSGTGTVSMWAANQPDPRLGPVLPLSVFLRRAGAEHAIRHHLLPTTALNDLIALLAAEGTLPAQFASSSSISSGSDANNSSSGTSRSSASSPAAAAAVAEEDTACPPPRGQFLTLRTLTGVAAEVAATQAPPSDGADAAAAAASDGTDTAAANRAALLTNVAVDVQVQLSVETALQRCGLKLQSPYVDQVLLRHWPHCPNTRIAQPCGLLRGLVQASSLLTTLGFFNEELAIPPPLPAGSSGVGTLPPHVSRMLALLQVEARWGVMVRPGSLVATVLALLPSHNTSECLSTLMATWFALPMDWDATQLLTLGEVMRGIKPTAASLTMQQKRTALSEPDDPVEAVEQREGMLRQMEMADKGPRAGRP